VQQDDATDTRSPRAPAASPMVKRSSRASATPIAAAMLYDVKLSRWTIPFTPRSTATPHAVVTMPGAQNAPLRPAALAATS